MKLDVTYKKNSVEKNNKKYYPAYLIAIAVFGIFFLTDKQSIIGVHNLNRYLLIGSVTIIIALIILIAYLSIKINSLKEENKENLILQNQFYKEKIEVINLKKSEIENNLNDLKLITEIGREITKTLSLDKIIDTLHTNIKTLMKADIFGIGILNHDMNSLVFKRTLEDSVILEDFSYNLEDENHFAVYTFKSKESLIINDFEQESTKFFKTVPLAVVGKAPKSLIYLPLIANDVTFGVITVQSFKQNSFNDYHLYILKSLSIYISIAYANSNTYKLIEQKSETISKANATKDKFFSIIAHDLKNPFNALLNYSFDLKENYENIKQGQIKNYIDNMYSSAKNLFNLLENLLEWARSQTGNIKFSPEILNLYELIYDNYFLIRNNVRDKEITININVDKSSKAFADRNMVNTILRNLLSNAVKFTPRKGLISVSCNNNEKYVEVKIEDSGIGFTEKQLQNIFKIESHESARGTENELGTGLGLLICKEFTSINKGEIQVENKKEKGSKITIKLPMSENNSNL